MPFNGAGVFNRLYSWVADKSAGLDISSTRMDADTNDITANGLGNALTRDGQGQATANLPMANFRHTGVANAQARTDYAAFGQVQDGVVNWSIAGGTSDAITATYTPVITALIDGQICGFRATAANATTTPTFSPNGITAEVITKNGGQPLGMGDIAGNLAETILRYNLANTRWELLNPSLTSSSVPTGAVLPFAGAAAPAGFLICDGSNISRTTYSVLYALLGTLYGVGDGSTTFGLPDYRGRVPAGLDAGANRITSAGSGISGNTLGATGGAEAITLITAQLPSHTHPSPALHDPSHTHTVNVGVSSLGATISSGGNFATTGPTTTSSAATGITLDANTGAAGGGLSHLDVQPTIMQNYIIKT